MESLLRHTLKAVCSSAKPGGIFD